jgi:hypothetical protein
MKKTHWLIFFILAFGGMGYFREFFFVHLNNIMYMKYYSSTSALAVPAIMRVFEGFSYSTLYYSKYPYTLVWTFLFFICSYFALKKLTANQLAIKLLMVAYALLLVVAGLSMVYGYFANRTLQNDEYTLSRWLLGIAQSPIICLILLASEKLYNKSIQS